MNAGVSSYKGIVLVYHVQKLVIIATTLVVASCETVRWEKVPSINQKEGKILYDEDSFLSFKNDNRALAIEKIIIWCKGRYYTLSEAKKRTSGWYQIRFKCGEKPERTSSKLPIEETTEENQSESEVIAKEEHILKKASLGDLKKIELCRKSNGRWENARCLMESEDQSKD